MHDLSLISTIAAGFAAAWVFGLLARWLRLSPIIGYLLAGILIGPHTPGFVGNQGLANQLAEVGVILLMFGVGLHFHLKDLLAVKRIAIPGAVGQSAVATGAAMVVFHGFGMSLAAGAVLGMAMAVASTVVLMRVLMDANAMNSPEGHAAVGWLIAEDVLTVILLVLIPVMGSSAPGTAAAAHEASGPVWWTVGGALLKLGALAFVVLWAGSRIIPRLLVRVAKLRSRELFTLTVLVFSIAVAAASYFFFGASMALGAFLAGMVVAQSPVSSQAAADALPMRDAFAVLFFVSVGMLFDPSFLLREPLMVLAALGVILVVKPLAALVIVAVLGYSARTALTVALGLAQIGEFSFILSELAFRHGLMPEDGHNILVAAAILSIAVNPPLFRMLPAIESRLQRHPRLWCLLNRRAERRLAHGPGMAGGTETPHAAGPDRSPFAILVGYGPVGRTVHRVLEESGLEVVVIDLNMDTVGALQAMGKKAIFGDASNSRILEEAGAKRASHLVVTVPDAGQRAAVVTAGKSLSPDIRVVVRARYLRERAELEQDGVAAAIFEEAEAAVALARVVLAGRGIHRDTARMKLQEIRFQLAIEDLPGLRRLTVGAVMVPWPRVQVLAADLTRDAAMARIAEHPHRFFPVVESGRSHPVGYVVADDLAAAPGKATWSESIRPLRATTAQETVGELFAWMNETGEPICLVVDGSSVLGLITRGHLLDRIETDFAQGKPRLAPTLLLDAVVRGGIVGALATTTREAAIRELAAAVPAGQLPAGVDAATIAAMVFEREAEVSTDLGNGIALPHARCAGLADPLVVLGRSHEGICYDEAHRGSVHLFFLLITPEDRPEHHLALLRQIARLVGNPQTREALLAASTPVDFLDLIARATRPAGKGA